LGPSRNEAGYSNFHRSDAVHAKAFETTVFAPAQSSEREKQAATIKACQKRRHTGKENTAVKMEKPNQRKQIPPPAKARLEVDC
jgi:hypothetical protein